MVVSQLNHQIILLLKRPLTCYWTFPVNIVSKGMGTYDYIVRQRDVEEQKVDVKQKDERSCCGRRRVSILFIRFGCNYFRHCKSFNIGF